MQKIPASILVLLLVIFLQPLIIKGQPQPSRAKFRFLIYGFPYSEMENSENTVGKKWGVEFSRIADCMVTEEFIDSVGQQNEKTEHRIASKYGKGWRKKFDQEVGVELSNRKVVATLVNELDYIKEKQSVLDKESNGLTIVLEPIDKSPKYNVLAQGWGKWKGKNEWVTYYKLLVDCKTKKIQLVSNKIVKV